MRNWLILKWVVVLVLLTSYSYPYDKPKEDHPTLAIGSLAPDFSLQGVDGKLYSLSSFAKARILVIIFTCNHCPTAQSYEDRIIKLTSDYKDKQVTVVAIMPNDPKALRLDEMDFSDLGDSFEDMKVRARDKNFNFPYLFDGETEKVSKAYGPVATPHVFVFDNERKLRYNGRFDDMENHDKTPRSNDARNAIEALLNNQQVAVTTTKVFGCSVKWADKRSLVQKSLDNWAKETVSVEPIDEVGLKTLLKNDSDKLRLITIWTNSSNSSGTNFNEFVTMNRMYRDRDFEFISVSADKPDDLTNVLSFLKNKQASNKNYLFRGGDIRQLANYWGSYSNVDLPYTILVEPGGKIVFGQPGPINPAEMKKTIVNNHMIGRYP